MSRRMERRDQGHPHRWTGSALCHPRLLKPFRIVQKLASVLADPSVRIREDPLEEVALPLGFSGGKEGRQRPRVCLEDSSGQHRCSGQPSPPNTLEHSFSKHQLCPAVLEAWGDAQLLPHGT